MIAERVKHAGGRPPKYKTVEEMSDKIDDYFNSITTTKDKLDEAGNPEYDNAGNEIRIVEYFIPPSILGMCLYLGIDRDTLNEVYYKKEEFVGTIKRAKAKVEQYLADQLNRTTQVAGIIFNLKNNFGWKDIQTVENTGPNGGPLLIQAVSAYSDEDLRLMAEIMERAQIHGEVVDIEPK